MALKVNNPNGERIKTRIYDGANTTIYTPYKELMQIRNNSGTFNYYYVYEGNTLVARINPDGSKHYYQPDNLGSTSIITDENGNNVESDFYSPYGESLVNSSEKKLYTGQFKDTTNQYYYGARYYVPERGQFISPDGIINNAYIPQTLNRYSYVLNNPYRYTDPTGHEVRIENSGDSQQKVYLNDYNIGTIIDGSETSQTITLQSVPTSRGNFGPIEVTTYDYGVKLNPGMDYPKGCTSQVCSLNTIGENDPHTKEISKIAGYAAQPVIGAIGKASNIVKVFSGSISGISAAYKFSQGDYGGTVYNFGNLFIPSSILQNAILIMTYQSSGRQPGEKIEPVVKINHGASGSSGGSSQTTTTCYSNGICITRKIN